MSSSSVTLANEDVVPNRLGLRQALRKRARVVWTRAPVRRSLWILATAAPFVTWGAFTSNPTLTPYAIAILAFVVWALWRPGEPPVLVFGCAVQWLQAALAVFSANFYHVPVAYFFGAYEGELATWYGITGVLALAIGIRIALIGAPIWQRPGRGVAWSVSPGVIFSLYMVGFMVFSPMQAMAFAIPGITQPVLAVTSLKGALIFLLFYCVLEQRRGNSLLLAALMLELLAGFFGYFAAFKNVFFLLLIATLTATGSLKGKRGFIAVGVTLSVVLLGIFWTSIKKDYRDFLTKGTASHGVSVSLGERADKLLDASTNFSWDQFDEGFQDMLGRISYVELFAATIAAVPREVPHENGELWLGALKHIVTPRLLFPGKSAISDSDRTNYYTGSRVAGSEQGTSIGIGYMAESYIDFGPYGMHFPILLLGLGYGMIYRYFIARTKFRLIGFALGTALLLPVHQDFGAANSKIVGAVVTTLIVSVIAFEFAKRKLRYLA